MLVMTPHSCIKLVKYVLSADDTRLNAHAASQMAPPVPWELAAG